MTVQKQKIDMASSSQSPLWEKALEKYCKELKDGDDFVDILKVGSMEELLSQTKSLEPAGARDSASSSSLTRLEPILGHLNDFSAIVALLLGADAKSAALVWGSIRIILTELALPAGREMLRDVLNMLEELSMSLPRFRAYENTLPMNDALESALLGAYTEMTCFCARTINFFRSHPHSILRRKSWVNFDGDFKQTMKRLKRLSHLVDSEADAARMRADGERNAEILAVMHALQISKSNHDSLPCYYVPLGLSGRFYGRDEVVEQVKNALNPDQDSSGIRSLALHGLGGVGKTRIALHYANSCRDAFDAILWISADNSIKMAQSFLEAAQRLGLLTEEKKVEDSAAAMLKVKAWLSQTACRWLLVFDNADDLEILTHAWPGSGQGSILITSRDFAASFSPAETGIRVTAFDESVGAAVLLMLVNQDTSLAENQSAAKQISQTLGGLPLALNQIGGFIVKQRLTLKDFIPLYERNAAKIHTRKSHSGYYNHSLSTVWEMALEKLSGDASRLQKLLAFLDPDKIHESILTWETRGESNSDFAFLKDEMDFLDAKEILLKAALIERFGDTTISIHRLVQSTVMNRLSPDERTEMLDHIIRLLLRGFPNTWQSDVGHQFSAWRACEMCLPHVKFLVVQVSKWDLQPSDSQAFADLVLRCCWYLYERENYFPALDMIQTATNNFSNKKSLAYASAVDLYGLLQLDMAQAQEALGKFEDALIIREELLGPDDPFIASSYNNIALAFTELCDLPKAYKYHQKAIDIRLRTNSDRVGNSYSNMSSLLLRMNKPNEAEEMLARCPSLKDFNDETFLSTGNPRFSGDMVLLSRIRCQQNQLDDAIRLASKALTFRQGMLGNRLKTCDSLYLVADLLQRRGNVASAIQLLDECVSIAESLPEGKGYLARAMFKLSLVHAREGNVEQSEACRATASQLYVSLNGDLPSIEETEDSYSKLVVWMLW